MLGLDLSTFTAVHVVISLIGIVSGFVVVAGLMTANRMDGMTAIFLITTILTSVTGFMFPFREVLPAHWIGAISLVALAVTIVARYARHLTGAWRAVYAAGAVVSLYLNVVVLIFQFFRRIPFLHALAPTETEPPLMVAQVLLLIVFVVLGVRSVKRFHPSLTSVTA